jgi:hypothetical protein
MDNVHDELDATRTSAINLQAEVNRLNTLLTLATNSLPPGAIPGGKKQEILAPE